MAKRKGYAMSLELFTQMDVEAIVGEMSELPAVAVVAVQYNWGPPISGRFDTDFLEVWVAAVGTRPGAVWLHGARNGQWNVDRELPYRSTVMAGGTPVSLYSSNEGGAMPDEFCVQLIGESGHSHWDSNGGFGINYHLVPYQGYGASVIVAEEAICRLPGIESLRLSRRPGLAAE